MSTHRERLTPLIEEALAVADQIPDGPDVRISVAPPVTNVWFTLTGKEIEDELMRALVRLWGDPVYVGPSRKAVWQVTKDTNVEAWYASRYFPEVVEPQVFRIPEAVTA